MDLGGERTFQTKGTRCAKVQRQERKCLWNAREGEWEGSAAKVCWSQVRRCLGLLKGAGGGEKQKEVVRGAKTRERGRTLREMLRRKESP